MSILNNMVDIIKDLLGLKDEKYRSFQATLIPTIDPNSIIGVRVPILREYAKKIKNSQEIDAFLKSLPHFYYEENLLHGFLIQQMKDIHRCIQELDAFLPYVNNWAVSDTMGPKVFSKNKDLLLNKINEWIYSEKTYTVRFAIDMLMAHFLDDDFNSAYLELVSTIHSEEYYINMMIAWYYATALAKQYDQTIPYIVENRLDKWVHNKTIQKAVESNRISSKTKEYLKALKRR